MTIDSCESRPNNTNQILLTCLPWLSGVLFVIAMFLPSITIQPPVHNQSGAETLRLMGWQVLIVGVPFVFANICWPILWVLARNHKWRACALLALIATAIGASSFAIIQTTLSHLDFGRSDGVKIMSLGSSFNFWIASFAVWILAVFGRSGKQVVATTDTPSGSQVQIDK